MTEYVDGKAIAGEIADTLQKKIESENVTPRIDIVMVGENPVTESFIRAKKRFADKVGVECVVHTIPVEVTTQEVLTRIETLVPKTQGIVVQLPLPEHIDTHAVLSAVPVSRDIDVLNEETLARYRDGTTPFVPPVAGALERILETHNVELEDTPVTVVGRGRLVGIPTEIFLKKKGAIVTMVDSTSSDEEFRAALMSAKVVVAGAGVPNLIQHEMVSDDVVLIDAGTSRSKNSIKGDVAPECALRASLISPTPGGVGPMTVAVLFENAVAALHATEVGITESE